MTIDTAVHVIPKGQPVTAVVGGVVAWRVTKGVTVSKYDLLAVVDDVEITAAYAGRVTALMVAEGGQVLKDAIIAYIDDGQPHVPQKPLRAPTTSRRAETLTSADKPATPQIRPIAQPDALIHSGSEVAPAGRAGAASAPQTGSNSPATSAPVDTQFASTEVPARRRNAHLAEPAITVLESGAPAVPKSKGKKRTKHTVYHVTEEQAGRIASLSFLFKSDPDAPNYSESEIVRAAVEHLLGQDRPTIEAILSHNRTREKSAGYGAGWKRPPRGKK